MDQARGTMQTKTVDLNANDIEAATKIVVGTAHSMGITVTDWSPQTKPQW